MLGILGHISETSEVCSFVYNGSSVRTVLYIKCFLGDAQAMTRLHDCNCAEHTCAHMLGVQMNVAPMNKTGTRSCDQVLYFVISGRAWADGAVRLSATLSDTVYCIWKFQDSGNLPYPVRPGARLRPPPPNIFNIPFAYRSCSLPQIFAPRFS